MEIKKMYINGEWVESISKKTRNVINPADGEIIAVTTEGDAEDVKLAVKAAKESFYGKGEWRRMNAQARADILLKIADKIEERKDEFAHLDTIDNGKPLREAEGDVDDGIHCFKYYAGLITKPYGGVYDVNDGFGQMHSYTVHEPVGVCGQITPWNYPFLMAIWKIAPALAAGNSIVFKPSSNTPLSSIALFEVFDEIGLPKGTVNLVLGSGATVGQEIAENKDVDMVTFTGSTEVGQGIARAAAINLKKTGLELGGKSPNVIFADSDFEGAVEWAMIGIFFNQGEVCSAGSRIIIEESIKDKFVARLKEKAEAMTIGNLLNNPDMGPLISKSHMEKVLKYIETGKKEGATLVCGGERYTEGECGKGYFVKPTIFDNCTSDMTIVKEEIFGPVVTIQTFKTEEEAVALANDTIYGLAGAVFTSDVSRAIRVIKEIRAGITWINCYNPTFNEAPWGGYKMSGYGRELGVHGLEEYQEIKQININLTPGTLGWYEH
ncbi:aldehyde dehydrogenase family protein [uncultured Clostridium sp.]|uniref:aldehyde dehydrogenase family protein n=1 Tax=uncultured Clostridium sp. TaxID=59620 RepID=UPI0025FA3614|nr:aldehyde dehydrogenase family protein [uncultured Clostridium sp.]